MFCILKNNLCVFFKLLLIFTHVSSEKKLLLFYGRYLAVKWVSGVKETHPRVAHAWLPDTVAVETPRVFFPPDKIHRQMCVFGELFSWATPTVYPDISSLFTVASRGPVDGVERASVC